MSYPQALQGSYSAGGGAATAHKRCLKLRAYDGMRTLLRRHRCSNESLGTQNEPRCLAHNAFAKEPSIELPDYDVPDLEYNLKWYQEEDGAQFSNEGVPETFQNDEDALFTWQNGAVVTDRSHWGRLRVTGQDRLKFLHSQSTADVASMQPGESFDTVFTSSKGRMHDLVTCMVQPNSVILLTSPNTADSLLEQLQRYILFGDRVEISDISTQTALFTVGGPNAGQTLAAIGAASAEEMRPGQHGMMQCSGSPVILAAGAVLTSGDWNLLADEGAAAELWHTLTAKGAVPMGTRAWQEASVIAGRPIHGITLTQHHNPLEAGLYKAVSLAKGCYMGQEALARAHSKGTAKSLWGVNMQQPASPGDVVLRDGEEVGTVSAVARAPDGTSWTANGYLRCRSKGQQLQMRGQQVEVNGCPAVIVDLPFLLREFPEGQGPAAASPVAPTSADLPQDRGPTKEQRLKQMQERLATWESEGH